MKKTALVFIGLLFQAIILAQAPHKIDYQAIVRDNEGLVMKDKPVVFQFTVRDLEAEGAVIYQEIHDVMTNHFGLVTLEIGAGYPISGTFNGINWKSGNKYLQVEIKFSPNDPYMDMGTSQLVSVPYCLYAEKAGNITSYIDNDTSAVNEIQAISISHDTITLSRNGGKVKLPSGITGSGQSGTVSCWTSSNNLSCDSKLFWDNTNKRLGIGTSNPSRQLDVSQSIQFPNTTDASTGIVFKGGYRFIHTYGTDNIFIGRNAGNFTLAPTTAKSNIAIGTNSSGKITTGYGNTAMGMNSLYECLNGYGNIAIGYCSMYKDSSGAFNTAVGYQSLYSNISGSYNNANGNNSLFYNISGVNNNAFGYTALYSNKTGNYNNAFGDALIYNVSGSSNSAFGHYALRYNTASYNSAFGTGALMNNSTGTSNTAIGNNALSANTSGSYNTTLGYMAGMKNKSGTYNTVIGNLADLMDTSNTNCTVIGNGAKANASNQVRLGNASISSFYCKGAYAATTDTLPNVYVSNNGQIKRSTSPLTNHSGTGAASQVAFWTSASTLSGDNNLYWDNVSKKLGIGTTSPTQQLHLTQCMELPNTISNTTGIIYRAGARYIHNYGTNNTFIGKYSGNLTLSFALSNVGIGDSTLNMLTTGRCNTAVGYLAMKKMKIGQYNTSSGYKSLYSNEHGSMNTATGYSAMLSNQKGSGNTAAGGYAQYHNIDGNFNASFGDSALYYNKNGNMNTAVGAMTLSSNTYGNFNTAVGSQSLLKNANGSGNTMIGYMADLYADSSYRNSTAIGYKATAHGSNWVQIGNDSVTTIRGKVPFSTGSDIRMKKEIQDVSAGLDFIMQLKPVEYKLNQGDNRINFGFIAQDIEKILGNDNAMITKDHSKEKMMSIRYTDLIAPLVKAIQEQQEMIRKISAKNEELQREIQRLKEKSDKSK